MPAVVAHGPRDRPLVALTFDGDMTPVMWHRLDTGAVASYANPAVIDELVRLRVPASFFLTGMWAQRYPTEVRRIAADPMFEVGNHSFAHGAFTPRCYTLSPLPWSGMRADVVRAAAVLQQLVPRLTPYFRFPGGCYDDRARAALAPLRLTVAGFDVASGDAFGRDPDAIVAHTLAAVRDGSIVVMHISAGTAPMTAVALPRIVAGLRTRGFRLVRFSDLVGLDGAARLDGPARLDRMAGSRAA
ncbi:MAG: polysaccharide deacetylase family protein [Actinobacteria bacterium]|nr:polysaccharide deacetylase family protein [Actinomycetota bacterium]